MLRDLINFYKVSDLEKTKLFYGGVLKLPIYLDQGPCIIFLVGECGKLGFCTHFPEKNGCFGCITFVYDTKEEVEEQYNFLLNQNVAVSGPPTINDRFKIFHFFAKDPNGLSVEFQKFL